MVVLRCHSHTLLAIDAVVFDKDGTLANAAPFLRHLAIARAEACIAPLQSQNSAGLKAALLEVLGVTATGLDPDGLMAVGTRLDNEHAVIEYLVKRGYPQSWLQQLIPDRFTTVDQQVRCKAARTPLYAGTKAMLQRLCCSPLKLAILSSDNSANVEEFLRYYGLDEYFDAWQGTDTGDLPKPDASLMMKLCAKLGVPLSRTVIIGDSWVDQKLAETANVAGFISVSDAWGRLPVPGARMVLRQWDDLQLS